MMAGDTIPHKLRLPYQGHTWSALLLQAHLQRVHHHEPWLCWQK
jgi:hypothetical protein